MKKKMIMAGVFVSALALTATSVFASRGITRDYFPTTNGCCGNQQEKCCPSTTVNADSTGSVTNNVSTRSDSGRNLAIAGLGTAAISSGPATASAAVGTDVEGSLVTVAAPATGTVTVNADSVGVVTNTVRTKANSGRNAAGSFFGGAAVSTGASSAGANVSTTVVGSTVDVTP